MAKKKREAKGFFGGIGLPVAKRYVVPRSRKWMVLGGVIAAAALLAVVVADFRGRGGLLMTNGPVSTSHSHIETDCQKCHGDGGTYPVEKCSDCHEKFGDVLGTYSMDRHVLYRTADVARLEEPRVEFLCVDCHTEHVGREGAITQVADERCERCHDFAETDGLHPEFEFVRQSIPDDGNLAFSHIRHTQEVIKKYGVELERSCLHCHQPDPDGKGFAPLDFDRHCDGEKCHIGSETATPRVKIRRDRAPIGVETLQAIRRRGDPGTGWTAYANPDEFEVTGGELLKRPVYHRDPWILENLRLLRRLVYPQAAASQLLDASPRVPPGQARQVYEEALDTLALWAMELRARPEEDVQDDLRRIEQWFVDLRRELQDPMTALPLEPFAPGPIAADVDVEEVQKLAKQLTEPCLRCHRLDGLFIARVQADQSVLTRAEFDHRAHILQRRCLECHDKIPVTDYRGEFPVDRAIDRAEIQNVPDRQSCLECHTEELAGDRCLDCHLFHPDKSRKADLLLYARE